MIHIAFNHFLTTPRRIRKKIRELGVKCRIVKPEEGIIVTRSKDVVINWGCGLDYRTSKPCKILNAQILDKLAQIELLQEADVRIPSIYHSVEDIEKYPVLSRLPSSHGGSDIIVVNNKAEAKLHNRDRYFTQLIDKKSEFRVHVLGGKSVEITRKVASDGVNPDEHIAWNTDFGFYQREIKNNPAVERVLNDIASKAAIACKYDFCAVDIILSKKGNFFVLECNSAPSLEVERRLDKYSEYFVNIHEDLQ